MTAEARRAVDAVLLYGLARRPLDLLLTAVTVAVVAWTRFGLLACGPWEWDETLFARGMLHFELAAHFPHPPGFPGWLAIGRLLMPVAGEPLRALQWASAALSVMTLWPLAALGRRVAAAPVAVAAAVLLMVAPGPWLYSVRGFSSTPAATFAIAAAAVAAGGLEGRRATLFSVLIASAFLIRPILLPGLVALWLVGAVVARPLRRLLPGVLVALGMVVASVLAMVRAEGGWAAFVRPFVAHTDKHFSRLVNNVGGWENIGLVKGLGGGAVSVVLIAAAVLGLGVWARRLGRRSALAWVLVVGVTVVQLLAIQNRSYARYAVPVHLALAPLVASAAAAVPPVLGSVVLATAAGWIGVTALPLVEEQHRHPLPGWRAVEVASRVAAERQMAVVVEPELYPFASYRWHLLERRGQEPPPLVLSPWAPEPWTGVDRPYLVATVHRHHYGGPLAGGELAWNDVSDALEPFTQQRFLEAWVITAPALPVGQWWPVETDPYGDPFQWGGPRCELVLPPLPVGTDVEVELQAAPGLAPLEVLWDGSAQAGSVSGGDRARISFGARDVRADAANVVSFRRERGYPPGGADPRFLAVQVIDLAIRGELIPWRLQTSSERDRRRLGVRLDGDYPPEDFGAAGQGVWLAPEARVEIPAVEGRLGLTLMAPRPTPPRTVIRVAGGGSLGPVEPGPDPILVWVDIGGEAVTGEAVSVEIASESYRPSEHGGGDDRELGIVLTSVQFEPNDAPAWTRPLATEAAGTSRSGPGGSRTPSPARPH
jgi:hypothetical protein